MKRPYKMPMFGVGAVAFGDVPSVNRPVLKTYRCQLSPSPHAERGTWSAWLAFSPAGASYIQPGGFSPGRYVAHRLPIYFVYAQ